jgi:hypothetical protein
MTPLSLRRLWTIYKKILANDGMSKRDLALSQLAFYSGAWEQATFSIPIVSCRH